MTKKCQLCDDELGPFMVHEIGSMKMCICMKCENYRLHRMYAINDSDNEYLEDLRRANEKPNNESD